MQVTLDYGRTGLPITLPADRLVAPPLSIRPAEPIVDAPAAIEDAIRHPVGGRPLAELAAGKKSACVVICDITRPVPNVLLLPPILRTIEEAGVPRDAITILIATGMHRPNEGEELVELVGPEIARTYNCVNHAGPAMEEHDYLGESPNGVPIWIDKRYMAAELKISTGLIEPHFMAGYSGGRKVICPGIVGLETVRVWHSPRFLEHPGANAGLVDGNPVHEENTAIALKAGCDFIVNVVIDAKRRVTWVGAGDMIGAWRRGVEFCRGVAQAGSPAMADVVVTSCAGYPLDTTWYQAVKGLVGALPVVKPGGTIVLAASLSEGLGSPEFRHLLDEWSRLNFYTSMTAARNGQSQTVTAGVCEMDEWQLVMMQKVLARCRVKVVTDGLSAEQLRHCRAEPAASVEAAVAASLAEYGPAATLAVIPKGPYVIPLVAGG